MALLSRTLWDPNAMCVSPRIQASHDCSIQVESEPTNLSYHQVRWHLVSLTWVTLGLLWSDRLQDQAHQGIVFFLYVLISVQLWEMIHVFLRLFFFLFSGSWLCILSFGFEIKHVKQDCMSDREHLPPCSSVSAPTTTISTVPLDKAILWGALLLSTIKTHQTAVCLSYWCNVTHDSSMVIRSKRQH